MLDQRGAAFDPIAVVVISDIADLADLGGMDMAADDPVDAARPRRMRHHLLEARDEGDRILDQIGRAHV